MRVTDLNTRDAANQARTLKLQDPYSKSGELLKEEDGRTVDIYVYGAASDAGRNAIKERQRQYENREDLTDEESAEIGAEYLAAITAGWSDNMEGDDGPIPFNHRNAKKLYKEQDWIATQVMKFAMDLSNYDPKKGSSASGSGSDTSHGSTQRRKGRKGHGKTG